MPYPPIRFLEGAFPETISGMSQIAYQVGSGSSYPDKIVSNCVAEIGSAAPTATNTSLAFTPSYNTGITTFGFSPGAAGLIAKVGVLSYISAYGVTGVNQSQVTSAASLAGCLAALHDPRAFVAKPFGWVSNSLVIAIVTCAVGACVTIPNQNSVMNNMFIYLNAQGFWF